MGTGKFIVEDKARKDDKETTEQLEQAKEELRKDGYRVLNIDPFAENGDNNKTSDSVPKARRPA